MTPGSGGGKKTDDGDEEATAGHFKLILSCNYLYV